MVDPITGGFLGWVCGKLGNGALKYLASNHELGRQLDKAIANWAKILPGDRRLEPASLYEAVVPVTPEERPDFCDVREKLVARELPSQRMWYALFLESWRWGRDNVDDPQAFFRLEESDAARGL